MKLTKFVKNQKVFETQYPQLTMSSLDSWSLGVYIQGNPRMFLRLTKFDCSVPVNLEPTNGSWCAETRDETVLVQKSADKVEAFSIRALAGYFSARRLVSTGQFTKCTLRGCEFAADGKSWFVTRSCEKLQLVQRLNGLFGTKGQQLVKYGESTPSVYNITGFFEVQNKQTGASVELQVYLDKDRTLLVLYDRDASGYYFVKGL